MTAAVTMTEDAFDHHLTRARPILVDFWAEGCGPCKTLVCILDEIAREHAATLRVGTVKLDDAPGLAHRFHIMALPTLIVFTNGKEQKRVTGRPDKGQLLHELEEFLT